MRNDKILNFEMQSVFAELDFHTLPEQTWRSHNGHHVQNHRKTDSHPHFITHSLALIHCVILSSLKTGILSNQCAQTPQFMLIQHQQRDWK